MREAIRRAVTRERTSSVVDDLSLSSMNIVQGLVDDGHDAFKGDAGTSSWGVILCVVFYIALIVTPTRFKIGDNESESFVYVASHVVTLALVLVSICIFWNRYLVLSRMRYILSSWLICLPPWLILWNVWLVWAVHMSYPDAGFVWADRIGGTTYLVLCVFVLSLDSCDCTGFFHRTALTLCYLGMVVGAFMATFVWPDVIIGKGIQTAAGLDPDLMFTKNGFR